jgi:hypothetical protein
MPPTGLSSCPRRMRRPHFPTPDSHLWEVLTRPFIRPQLNHRRSRASTELSLRHPWRERGEIVPDRVDGVDGGTSSSGAPPGCAHGGKCGLPALARRRPQPQPRMGAGSSLCPHAMGSAMACRHGEGVPGRRGRPVQGGSRRLGEGRQPAVGRRAGGGRRR